MFPDESISLSAYRKMQQAEIVFVSNHYPHIMDFLEKENITYKRLPCVRVIAGQEVLCQEAVSMLLQWAQQHEVLYITVDAAADPVAKQLDEQVRQVNPGIAIAIETGSPIDIGLPFDMQPLLDVMAELRSDDHGCPWDRAQTHRTLRRYLLEEVYEMLDAVDMDDMLGIREEMGDILYQIAFHCRLAEEKGLFSAQDVVKDVTDKMIRRHPHVFDKKKLENIGKSMVNWDRLKQGEQRQQHQHLLDGVVKGMPSLLETYKLQEKSAKVGFEWEVTDQVWDKVQEEVQELKDALQEKNPTHIEEVAGDVLFVLVNLFRRHCIEPECALHRANSKFRRRFSYVEDKVKESGKSWQMFTLLELNDFWKEAKEIEGRSSTV
jgi:tetrapyrrole methylase family protein/MazG family protein